MILIHNIHIHGLNWLDFTQKLNLLDKDFSLGKFFTIHIAPSNNFSLGFWMGLERQGKKYHRSCISPMATGNLFGNLENKTMIILNK